MFQANHLIIYVQLTVANSKNVQSGNKELSCNAEVHDPPAIPTF